MNWKQLSIVAGPIGFLACQFFHLPPEQRIVLGTSLWMLLWSQSIPEKGTMLCGGPTHGLRMESDRKV